MWRNQRGRELAGVSLTLPGRLFRIDVGLCCPICQVFQVGKLEESVDFFARAAGEPGTVVVWTGSIGAGNRLTHPGRLGANLSWHARTKRSKLP